MRSYELLSNEAAYPSTPGKTHDMGNGKVSLKDKHLQSNETDMSCSKSNLQTLSIEDMRQMHASGPVLELWLFEQWYFGKSWLNVRA